MLNLSLVIIFFFNFFFSSFAFFIFQKLIQMAKYDNTLYVNVDDLVV